VNKPFHEYSVEPLLLSGRMNEILPVGHNITDIWLKVKYPQYRPGKKLIKHIFVSPQTVEKYFTYMGHKKKFCHLVVQDDRLQSNTLHRSKILNAKRIP